MDFIYIDSGKRREKFKWSEETRWFFTKIADEFEDQPNVRVAMNRTGKLKIRPVIGVRKGSGGFPVMAFGDGIAVRLSDEDKQRALEIMGARELGKGDPIGMKKMISLPWSAHEHWKEYMHAAVNNAQNR